MAQIDILGGFLHTEPNNNFKSRLPISYPVYWNLASPARVDCFSPELAAFGGLNLDFKRPLFRPGEGGGGGGGEGSWPCYSSPA